MHSLVSGGIRAGRCTLRGASPQLTAGSNGRLPPVSPAPSRGEPERAVGGDDGRFSAAVAAVAAAFGDPTRRDIFLHVRAAPGGTASEVASTFSLHPNVARHHLQRLVDGGYLRVETGRKAPGAGRPSKQFFCVEGGLTVGL